MEDGAVKVNWPDDMDHRRDDRLSPRGKAVHLTEIFNHMQQYMPRRDEAKEKLQKYKDFNACEVKSPKKEALKEQLKNQ